MVEIWGKKCFKWGGKKSIISFPAKGPHYSQTLERGGEGAQLTLLQSQIPEHESEANSF